MAAASAGSMSATLCSGGPFALRKTQCTAQNGSAPESSCGIARNTSYLTGTRILGVPRLPNRRTKRTGFFRGIRSNAEFYHEGQRFQASREPSPAGHILLERTNGDTLPFATVSVVPREPGLPPPLDSEGLVADGGPVGILEPQEMELWLSEVEWVDPRVDIDPVSVSRAARLQMRVDAAAAAGYPSWQTGPRRLVSSIRKALPPSIGGSPEGLAGLTAAVVILLAVLWKLFKNGETQPKNAAYGNSPPGTGSTGVARAGGSSYSTLQSASSQVSYKVGGAAQTAERTAQAAKDEAAKRAQAQLADIKKRVENVKQADNKLKQAGKEVKDKVEEGVENVKEGAQAAKGAVQERVEKVEEKAEKSTGRSGTGDSVKSVKDAKPQPAQGDARPEGSSGRGGSGATVISGVEGKSTKGLEQLVKGDVGDPKAKLSAKPVPEKPQPPAPEPTRSSFWAGLKKSAPTPPIVVSGVEGSKPEQLESLVKGTVGKPIEREGVAETGQPSDQKQDAGGVSPLQANSADAVLSAGGATKSNKEAPGKSAPQTPLQRNSADAVLTRNGSSLDKEKAALSFAINQSGKPSNPAARGATTQRENVSQRASDLARVLEDAKKRSAEIREAQARSALSQAPTKTKTPSKPVEAPKTETPQRPKTSEPPKASKTAAPAKPAEAPKPQITPKPSDVSKPKPTEATKTEEPRKLFDSELPEAFRAKSSLGTRAEEAPKLFDNVVVPKPAGLEPPKLFENVEVPKPSGAESEEAPKLFENVEVPKPTEGGDSEEAPKLFDAVEIPDAPKPNPSETEEAPKLFDSVEVPEVKPSDGSEAPKLFENVKVPKPAKPDDPPYLFDAVEIPDALKPKPENGAEAPKLFENVEIPKPAEGSEPEEPPKLFPDTPEPESSESANPEEAPKLFPETEAPVSAKATGAAKPSAEPKSKGFFGDIFNFGRGKSVAVSQTPTTPLEGADAVMLEAKAGEPDVISSTPTEVVAQPQVETLKSSEASKPFFEATESPVSSKSPETPKPLESLKAAVEPKTPDEIKTAPAEAKTTDAPKKPDAPKASDAPETPKAPKSDETATSALKSPSGASSPAKKGIFGDVFNWNRGKNSGTAAKSPTAVLVASDGQMLTAKASSLDAISQTDTTPADKETSGKLSDGSSSGTPVSGQGQQTAAEPSDADTQTAAKPLVADTQTPLKPLAADTHTPAKPLVAEYKSPAKPSDAAQQAKPSESNGSDFKSGAKSSVSSSPTLPVLSKPPPKPVLSPAPPKPVLASSVPKPIISEAPPKPAVTETPEIPTGGITPAKTAVGSTPTKVVANDTAVFGSPKLPVVKDVSTPPAGGASEKKQTGGRSEERNDVTGGDSEERSDVQEAKDILEKILLEDLPLPEPTGKSSQRQRLIAKVQNVLPAVAVSIGAAGGLATGIDGALETVGFAALASFTASTLLWANSREELKKNIEEIKSSKDLVEFLKEKDITPEP